MFYCMSMFSCHQACLEDSGCVSGDYNMAEDVICLVVDCMSLFCFDIRLVWRTRAVCQLIITQSVCLSALRLV